MNTTSHDSNLQSKDMDDPAAKQSTKNLVENAAQNLPNVMSQELPIVNIAAYKFVTMGQEEIQELRTCLRDFCNQWDLRGTILLSSEGINSFIAGSRESIDRLISWYRNDVRFSDIPIKESFSAEQPFNRMLVKIKNEIIAFGIDGIEPAEKTSPRISATELREWLDQGKPLTLLDVRNDYEVEVGTFKSAIPIGVDNFREFPDAITKLPEEIKQQPIVTFCTGGIRCEKAGPFLENAGFQNVLQLDGGILKYFEDCGGKHYEGECFVFDKRVALDANLAESDKEMCFVCQAILTPDEMIENDRYREGKYCPHCFDENYEKTIEVCRRRNLAIARAADPLPGKGPYLNRRPVRVIKKFDGAKAIDFVCSITSFLTREDWLSYFQADQILRNRAPIRAQSTVRSGDRLIHIMPDTVEPDVNAEIEVLFEDETLVVIKKPAPIPMHACGRFSRNTIEYILNQVYAPEQLRQVHRLDANTTGVVVLCKTKDAARWIAQEFEQDSFKKKYLARVRGILEEPEFECNEPIGVQKNRGGARGVSEEGQPSRTLFKQLKQFEDGTSLLEVTPLTGRTNQIRIHLASLNLPIVGDPIYNGREFAKDHSDRIPTLTVNDHPMCLHAWKASFRHPVSKRRVEFEAPQPNWCAAD